MTDYKHKSSLKPVEEPKKPCDGKALMLEKTALKIFLALMGNSSMTRTDSDMYTVVNRENVLSERSKHLIKASITASKIFHEQFQEKKED